MFQYRFTALILPALLLAFLPALAAYPWHLPLGNGMTFSPADHTGRLVLRPALSWSFALTAGFLFRPCLRFVYPLSPWLLDLYHVVRLDFGALHHPSQGKLWTPCLGNQYSQSSLVHCTHHMGSCLTLPILLAIPTIHH